MEASPTAGFTIRRKPVRRDIAASSPANPPQYEPLDFSRFETRLLYIHPSDVLDDNGDDSSIVQCQLKHISLLDPPTYIALSYCWGDPTITKPILIGKQVVSVTTNLEMALRELRRRGIERVWADAVCINQNDLYERSQQVLQMGQIYAQATEAFAWLGPSDNDSDLALKALKNVSSQNAVPDIPSMAIRTLFERPFWRRMWIIQEMAKPRKVLFGCGKESISWSALMDAVRRKDIQRLLSKEQEELLKALEKFKTWELGTQILPLSRALVISRKFLATDPRDKLYALLGLASDSSKVVPLPNYSNPVSNVFLQATQRMMINLGDVAIILLARRRAGNVDLPSWYPDWLHLGENLPNWVTDRVGESTPGNYGNLVIRGPALHIQCWIYGAIYGLTSPAASLKSQDRSQWSYGLVWDVLDSLTLHKFAPNALWDDVLDDDQVNVHHKVLQFARFYLGKSRCCPQGLQEWVKENSFLQIGPKTLLQHVEKTWSPGGWLLVERHRELGFDTASSQTFQALEAGLRGLQEYEMRVAVVSHDPQNASKLSISTRVLLVYRYARPGDLICFLQNCRQPVVLRKVSDGYRYVGEASWRLAEDEEKDIVECSKSDVIIY